jgi:hypothetical protein
LIAPYILLQPEINIGKTIWHISRVYKDLIGSQKTYTVCTLAFCKELLIRMRPDLETYVFLIIRDSEVLYYKYFFLYVLQLDKYELCRQVILQPSFFSGFRAFLSSVIRPDLNYYLINLRERKVARAIIVLQNFMRLITSQEKLKLSEYQEVIRRIFVYFQSGFNFKFFDHSFFYWTAKIAILLRIFTHLDWEDIRTIKTSFVHDCIKQFIEGGRSSYIPQYQIILDVCPITVISHFLRLRKKLWKHSDFIFAGSISGLPLISESLNKIVSIQLRNIGLSKEDLDSVKGECKLLTNLIMDPKPFDKTSNMLFSKYNTGSGFPLFNTLEWKKQGIIEELARSLYNTPPDADLDPMTDGFISLELLKWQQRNLPDNSRAEVF